MNVIICEDDADYRDYIRTVLSRYIQEQKSNTGIVLSTDNPGDVFDYIKSNAEVSVYYLDIRLEADSSGLDIAAEIRKKDALSYIVFITNYDEMMPLTYEYKLTALDYIVKNDDAEKKLCECLTYTENHQRRGYEKCLNIQNKQKNLSVPFDEICYIESVKSSHKLNLYYDYGMVIFYASLKEVEQQLDERFVRCHKSIIVNTDKIISTDKHLKMLELKHGYRCMYSLRCKELKI